MALDGAATLCAMWKFYVYACGDLEAPIYVGKGSGRRAAVSARARGAPAAELARFEREDDAYAFERQAIAELSPALNKHPGGNGSRVQPKPKPPLDAWDREAMRCGTALIAAAFLATKGIMLCPFGKLDWRVGELQPLQADGV